ncbi:hypothetical protein B0J14DRAFT_567719 [Halenospora varia]|nr:hypothetical protein B0J14DRAFT_567719 [Halenospora varia]
MSSPHYYDAGSIEVGPSSPPNSINSDGQDSYKESEYVYVKYRIPNKRLSSMEDDIIQMKATIDNYAMAIQNETQFRELCQLALLDEQIKHSECRAAYLRLFQFLNSRPQSSDGETAAYKSQIEHLLMVIGQLQMKIQNMREQHSVALCVAADHIARTEEALERLQMTRPGNGNNVISDVNFYSYCAASLSLTSMSQLNPAFAITTQYSRTSESAVLSILRCFEGDQQTHLLAIESSIVIFGA